LGETDPISVQSNKNTADTGSFQRKTANLAQNVIAGKQCQPSVSAIAMRGKPPIIRHPAQIRSTLVHPARGFCSGLQHLQAMAENGFPDIIEVRSATTLFTGHIGSSRKWQNKRQQTSRGTNITSPAKNGRS
jgi:hypothetical protein